MKKQTLLLAALILGAATTVNAQSVGIGTPSPVASSILELSSTSKGFLMPRMTTTEREAIVSPSKGLQAFDTTTNTIWFHNGTVWINSGTGAGDNLGNHSATQELVLNNNTLQLGAAGGNLNKIGYNATVDGPLITGNAGGSLGTGASTRVLNWFANGTVGIGTTTPFATAKLQVAQDKATYGEFGQLMATGVTDPNQKLVLGYNTTTDKGFVQSVHSGLAWTNLSLQPNDGNVTVGAFTGNATSKFEVNGSSTNYTAYNAGSGTSINYQLSNLAYTTANAGAFTLTGIKDGGTYTLSVRGTTSGTSTFTAAGFTVKYANNRTTIAGTETLYTFIVMGSIVYVYTATGF